MKISALDCHSIMPAKAVREAVIDRNWSGGGGTTYGTIKVPCRISLFAFGFSSSVAGCFQTCDLYRSDCKRYACGDQYSAD